MQLTKYENPQTIVFLPGMFAGGWIWSEAQRYVANADQFVIDQALCEIDTDLSELVRLFCNEIVKIPGSVVLVGNSLGSLIALYVARALGEKISMVVISGSAGFAAVKLDAHGFVFHRKDPKKTALKLADLIFYNKEVIAGPYLDVFIKTFSENPMKILRLMDASNRALDAHKLIGEVECPVNAIWGARDIITPLESAEATFKEFNVGVQVIQDCGHSPMCEKPEEFVFCLNKIIGRS